MSSVLQLLGSIASIGSIPLAIYLYLRNQEVRHSMLRREIVKALSFQIGEGRELTKDEITIVINSKIRENRGKIGSISEIEITEDLITETMINPMLDSERKDTITTNLKQIYEDLIGQKGVNVYRDASVKEMNLSEMYGIIGTAVTFLISIFVFVISSAQFNLPFLDDEKVLISILTVIASFLAVIITAVTYKIYLSYKKKQLKDYLDKQEEIINKYNLKV